jgi:hypothetical protein
MSENKNLIMAVLIPALQSVISALWMGVAIGLLAWFMWGVFWQAAGILAALTGAGVWFSYLRRWNYLTGLEPYQEPDPLPTYDPGRVKIELLENGGQTGHFLTLPARAEQLAELGRGIERGAGLGINSWVGSGRPFSRSEFEALRDELLRRGLLAWVNERARAQGVILTPQGRAVMRYFSTVEFYEVQM